MVHSGFEASAVVESFSSLRGLVAMARAFIAGPRVPAPAPDLEVSSAPAHPEAKENAVYRRGDVVPASPAVLQAAFDYRGDVTLTLENDAEISGYVANLREAELRLWRRGEVRSETVATGHVKQVAFSGRDTASGQSFETWRRHWESTHAPRSGTAETAS